MNTNKPGGHGDQSIQRLMGKAAEAETKLEAEHEHVEVDIREIIKRVMQLASGPSTVWDEFSRETFTVEGLYRRYLVPVVVASSICILLGVSLFSGAGFSTGLEAFVFSIVGGLSGPFAALVILGFLVPYFGGVADRGHMLAFVTFSLLPVAITGILAILPPVFVLSALRTLATLVAALLSMYLVWTGIPPMLGVPFERRTDCFVAYVGAVAFAGAAVVVIVSLVS